MSDRAGPIPIGPGQGIRLLVDDTEYAIDAIQPAARIDQGDPDLDAVTDVECLPYAGGDRVRNAPDIPTAELQFVDADHPRAVVTVPDRGRGEMKTTREVADAYLRDEFGIGVEDLDTPGQSRLQLERDLAVRQAKLSKAGLQVVRRALNDNRPLEALYTANNEIDRLDEELEAIEEIEEAGR